MRDGRDDVIADAEALALLRDPPGSLEIDAIEQLHHQTQPPARAHAQVDEAHGVRTVQRDQCVLLAKQALHLLRIARGSVVQHLHGDVLPGGAVERLEHHSMAAASEHAQKLVAPGNELPDGIGWAGVGHAELGV